MNNNDIFSSFGNSVRKILLVSQKIAQKMNASTGTEHLLLAILVTGEVAASQLLRKNMIHLDQVQLILKLNNIREQKNTRHITKQLQNVLKLASDRLLSRKGKRIESLDLLWGIIKYSDCAACKIFKTLGINLARLESEINQLQQYNTHSEIPKNDSVKNNLEVLDTLNSASPNVEPETGFGVFPPGVMFTSPHFQTQNKTKSKTRTPHLDQFGTNLTMMAKKNKLDPIIGRGNEIERLTQVLCRRIKNNPVLIGDPGVGKTAIVEGLAQQITMNQVPANLINKQIIVLDMAAIVAGTMYRGQFETRLKEIISEAKRNNNIILFIDEIHTIVGSGSAEGSMDTANILKPALSKGEIRLIGATTHEDYRKFIEKDAALERRLQKITVIEPTIDESVEILKGIRSNFEKFHSVEINDEAITSAVKLAARYINDRFLPDKAIDLIDEAAAATHLTTNSKKYTKTLELTKKLNQAISKKEKAVEAQDYAQAAYLKSRELQLKQELALLEKKQQNETKIQIITAYNIAQVVSHWTKIPLNNLVKDNFSEIKNLEQKLSHFIIGQKEAVNTVASAIRRAKTHLSDPDKPLGTFMLLGPTGVGKTELAKVLARVVFGSDKNLVKIDMSEFMERHNTSRLVGAPPGYVGYEDAGKLTEAVRRQPYSVILLDEIEKAHPEVYNILLQIMDEGYITDSKGRQINFRNTVVIMTSNIGMAKLSQSAAKIGFNSKSKLGSKIDYREIESQVKEELKQTFAPEFLNRLDQTIIFKPLSYQTIKKIVKLRLRELTEKIIEEKIKVTYSSGVVDFIAKTGFDPEYGARPIKRTITKHIEEPLSEAIIKKPGLKEIKIGVKKGRILLRTK